MIFETGLLREARNDYNFAAIDVFREGNSIPCAVGLIDTLRAVRFRSDLSLLRAELVVAFAWMYFPTFLLFMCFTPHAIGDRTWEFAE